MDDTTPPPVLTLQTLAALLAVPVELAEALVLAHEIPHVRIGKSRRFTIRQILSSRGSSVTPRQGAPSCCRRPSRPSPPRSPAAATEPSPRRRATSPSGLTPR
jgi:excisionase family DNA binding protein